MSNLIEYDLARQIWCYAGKRLEFIDLQGRRGSGVLEGIQVHQETQETIALLRTQRVTHILPCLFPPTKVPLRQVILPSTGRSCTRINSAGETGDGTPNLTRQRFKNFQYYNNLYVITYMSNFKTGDEVVWTRYSSGDVAFLGFIVVTAERQDTENQIAITGPSCFQEVAIIKFDVTPYTRTGEKAPGYFEYIPGIENTFLIPMRELLKLSEWVAITAKVEDNSYRDLWQYKEARQDNSSGDKQPSVKTDTHHAHSLIPQRLSTKSEPKLQRPLENVQIERASSNYHEKRQSSCNIDAMNSQPKNDCHWSNQLKSFQEAIHSSNELSKFSPIWQNEWLHAINNAKLFTKIQQGGGFGVGIQGKNYSSYMDASLVALFYFNKSFDSCLHQCGNESNDKLTSRVKKVMRDDIILAMRKEFHVSHEKVLGLYTLLSQEMNTDSLTQCMDVDEFLTDLFIKMDTPPLLNYDDGDGDYFHRIALPLTWQRNRFVPYMTVQSLLESSFETYNVKLTALPHGGLIIKLPVSDGSLIPCSGVIPNLTLDLSSIVSSKIPSTGDNNIMNLRSVICQKDGHFVAFVRTGLEKNSPWIFMDSNPAMCAFAYVLSDVDERIGKARGVIEGGKPGPNVDMYFDPYYQKFYEPACGKFSLFKNAYICLYV